MVIAILISVLLVLGYGYLIYRTIGDFLSAIESWSFLVKLGYFIALTIPGLLLFFLLREERYIYYWDFSGYWIRAIDFTEMFFDTPFIAFDEIYNSIRHREYNYLANLFITPFNKLFGLTFPSYVLSVYFMFMVPMALLISNLVIQTLKNRTNAVLNASLPFLCLMFTPILVAIRYGFIDVIGLVAIFFVLNIVVKQNYFRKFNFWAAFGVGILILILVFSRRWYAFWATSFYLALFVTVATASLFQKDWKSIKHLTLNLLIAGLVPTLIMLLFFYPFFEMSVLKDYSDIYSAFRRATTTNQIQTGTKFFGFIVLFLLLIGAIIQWGKARLLSAFLLVSMAIIIVLFTRINDFGGYQHYYLIVPSLIIFFLRGIAVLPKFKNIPVLVILALLIINNYFVFSANSERNVNTRLALFSTTDGSKKVRTDYDVIQGMADDVLRHGETNQSTYILSSSKYLNDAMVRNVKLPQMRMSYETLFVSEHVDKRDKFPHLLFKASYVVITDPVQQLLGANNQHLVGYFNEAILHGKLRKHYEEVKTYKLEAGVTAYLMKRTSGLNDEEIDEIQEFFKQKYPDYPNMYIVNRTLLKTAEILPGDGFGKIEPVDDRTILIHPGDTKPSIWAISLDPLNEEITFLATFQNKEIPLKKEHPEKFCEVELIIKLDGELLEKIYVTYKQDVPISFPLNNNRLLEITINKGNYNNWGDSFLLKNFEIKNRSSLETINE